MPPAFAFCHPNHRKAFMMFKFLLFTSYVAGVFGSSLEKPSDLPCSFDNAKCNTGMIQWIFTSAITGDPANGMEVLDPMYHELVQGNLGYVNYTLKNVKVEGYKDCTAVNVSFGADVTTLHMGFMCPRFHMEGEYNVTGKLLSLPIDGQGDMYATGTNYHILIDINVTFYKEGQTLHMKHKEVKSEAIPLGELDLELGNLFDGDKKLSEDIHKFAKENPKMFGSLIHEPYFKSNMKKIMKNFNSLFKQIPITDLMILNEKNLEIENL